MKKIFLTSALLLALSSLFGPILQAQNLVFDDLVYFKFGGDNSLGPTSNVYYWDTTVTVPANMVWKITSINASTNDSTYWTPVGLFAGYSSTYGTSVWLDGVAVVINPTTASTGGHGMSSQTLWIPAGTHQFRMRVPNGGGPRVHHCLVTGLQFDIQ